MFCSNCGREIGEDAKFCNFCGLPISQRILEPISESISQPISDTISESVSQPISVVEAVENPSQQITESEAVYVTLPEPPRDAPKPENIPHAGVAASPQPYQTAPTSPMPERKYTLGHIIMCLAAVAVMAIVAGIFAGLYFGS